MQNMPRQFDTVRRAPFQTGFCKILRKQFVHDVDIVGGGAVEIFALFPPIQLGNHKFPAEFFCQKNNTNLLIGQDFIKLLLKLLLFVHNRTFNPGQTHAGPGVDIVTDQIHFHKL